MRKMAMTALMHSNFNLCQFVPRALIAQLSLLFSLLQNFLLDPPDRCSLVDLLKDALQEVLFQRPDNPVQFLQKYFSDLNQTC